MARNLLLEMGGGGVQTIECMYARGEGYIKGVSVFTKGGQAILVHMY